MLKTVLVALMAAFLLSGCAWFIPNATQDYEDVRALVRDYVRDNRDARRDIRKLCLELVEDHARQLIADKKYADAMELLKQAYPPAVITSLLDDKEGRFDNINKASVCG